MNNLVIDKINADIIKSIPFSVTDIEITGTYVLSFEDYNNLIVYTNVSNVSVYDIDDFEFNNDIKFQVRKNVSFKTERFNKFKINKVEGYKKNSLTINLPFDINEENDFNLLLNYIKDIDILNINFACETVDKVFDIVYKIEEKIGKKIAFINVSTTNRTISDIEKLKLLENNRIIKIWYEEGITDCSIDEFIVMRKNLDSIIKEINSKNLTNFEKVLYAYDIVKKFKFLQSTDSYSMDGRHLHKVFNTKNIVCSGFARIITEVLNELGISASVYKLVTQNNVLHARCLVHIIDSKYGINAICSMEPTWESAINDEYAYSLFLTPINKLKEWFPKEKFYGDIDVLNREKKINDITLKDRISLYKLFCDNDLNQDKIDSILNICNNNISLNSFVNALINVRCSQGYNKNILVANIDNIIKYNDKLTNYLNDKMNTNINFFGI